MLDLFLFIGLPYAAIIICIVGTVRRFKNDRYGITTLSSQFLEGKKMLWGSAPWHIGILIVFFGHFLAFLVPSVWHKLMAVPALLTIAETLGMAASIICLIGLIVLIFRRATTARLQKTTKLADFLVAMLLLMQVALGLMIAGGFRWGASWSTGTLAPYVWSLVTLGPDISVIRDMPVIIQAHVVGAWLIVLVFPFTRLIHMITVPVQYLLRSPQKVVWTNPRRNAGAVVALAHQDSRRHFIKASLGLSAASLLLSVGVLDKLGRFFQMPGLHHDEEADLLETRLRRLQLTAEEKQLELERLRSNEIYVAKLSELNGSTGKYFIDYAMRPGLAFRTEDGWPMLLSAKCTHLGCTVGNQVDANGKILCPCHVSYFDIKTGLPNEGAPAKAPLDRIAWIVRDEQGGEIATESSRGSRTGRIDPQIAADYSLYIVRSLSAEA
ncbi:MAG: respiratory nitrate reductase subunit gamma [Calditrichaeota bacterium]|nr:respiratory nitrate reductase subunit gamma [Calditrichota bacterium]MCB9367535.1 respiratory nitrate reductase subunit gamma [Calditrichota bacterium]